MDIEKKEQEVKEVTMDELKSIITDGVKSIIPDIKTEIMDDIKSQAVDKSGDSEDEKVEKSAQFVRDLVNGKLTDEQKAVSSETSSFGYTVPTELADFILTKRDKISKMRKLAFVFQMSGNFQLPTEGTGVTSYWVGENTEVTESNPTIGKKDLVDYYLAARVLIPRKLINTSAYNIVNFIGELCARSIRDTEETAFVAGDGSSKPTGLRSASLTSVSQAGANLDYDDIVNLFYALPEQYRDNSVFLTSSAGMKALRKIKDDNGVPIFDTRDQKVFNKMVLETADIPATLGSSGDATEIYFGDMWYYWIKDGETMFVDTDKVISKLQTEIVVAEAVDGVLTLTDAVRKLTGVK